MRVIFYIGIIGLVLFEIANVYFIMPMPGSQRINSIDIAYFLHTWRWAFRAIFGIMILAGALSLFQTKSSKIAKWIAGSVVVGALVLAYVANFVMAADSMFYQPSTLILKNAAENKVDPKRLVIGVEINGQARAYPIQYIGYHHQVRDTLGGKPIIVTYCTVCRTGRVFEPIVNGKVEQFRLVGMDHFNAMFEDNTTGSWWRQANGEAIAGKLKGQTLPELDVVQVALAQWFTYHPRSLVMQPDTKFQEKYDSMSTYESGKKKSALTRRDTASWKEKSWIVGIEVSSGTKAYDWNDLQQAKVINDMIGYLPITLILASDKQSFVALRRATPGQKLVLQNDTLIDGGGIKYSLLGESLQPMHPDLLRVNAYQEYWHSWRTFHPDTQQYK
ncbi:DUF3179 domain-containing (seleno)protein [Runella sp. MFBS21]|uniref:DUF3179 domain-containing (seleno)protein n=1 Tax=Runella sp. MFBS21 TaxID=3034018 RepID=UPI0023F82D20|nr:DUF3179 domain-containing (seleno)protein [Runella sp. MFBS21]MDF7818400.1 DUF3179 domain-containing (seleno)protein [Runella sp. MFBS21]